MIVVYPMLTSPGVSPNVLPGIIKAVEKYILIYKTDEVLKRASATSAGNIISTGVKILAGATATALAAVAAKKIQDYVNKEGEELTTLDSELIMLNEKDQDDKGFEVKIKAPDPSAEKIQQSAKLDIPNASAVSLEPTWLQVTTQRSGLQILGIKVVPFRIRYPDHIISLLMRDRALRDLDFLTSKYMRGMTRVLSRVLPSKGTISGNFKKDVLDAQTTYGKNMFLCLSQLDLEAADNTFSRPAGIKRLHELGWASIIIADDVARTGTFCMKEFSGICSVVPYSYMFASLGKDQAQAYQDLEDIKKKSGPFFKMSTHRKKVFSLESKSNVVVDKYLDLLEKENE